MMETEQSPVELSYPLMLPEGTQVYEAGSGALIFEDANQEGIGKIESPWAVDALGASVPTWYELRENTLVQHVDHRAGDFVYPVVADPQWSYTYTAIAKSGIGATVTGSETPARAFTELKRCFNCSFPVSGAPTKYPGTGQIIQLNASPFSFVKIPAPVVFFKAGPSTEPDWSFSAMSGHFDGVGSRISFDFYKPSGYPVRIAISATIMKDNGPIANAVNASVAKQTWSQFITKLIQNIRSH